MDSVFSLVLLVLFMSIVMINISFRPSHDFSDVINQRHAEDLIRNLYLDNTLYDAVVNDLPSAIEKIDLYFNESLPSGKCGKIVILEDSDSVLTLAKNGCFEKEYSLKVVPLYLNETTYLARVKIW